MNIQKKQFQNSIAVLPFVNMSSDEENEYFSDGITEEILNVLAKAEGLHVTARTSSFAFKGKNIDIRSIGSDLGVSYILEGSVRRSGKQVRITAQLINTSDGYHIWSEKYDRELKDIFAIQDEIAVMIVDTLKEKLSVDEFKEFLPEPATGNMDAYDYYLKGRFGYNKGSKDGAYEAIRNFELAINIDPNLVLAHTGLCACYIFLGGNGIISSEEALKNARKHTDRANEIDDGIAESHLALAYMSFWGEWNFPDTLLSIKNAMQLNPGLADSYRINSLCMLASGNSKEAFDSIKTSLNLDPLSLKGWFQLGECFYRTGKYREAIAQFDKTLQENPFYQQARILKAWCHYFLDELDTAMELFDNIPEAKGLSVKFVGGLAFVYAKKGETDKVIECLQKLQNLEENRRSYLADYCYALIYRSLNEKDKMYNYLKKCLDKKLATLLFIKVDPVWTEYKTESRFIQLVDEAFGIIPENSGHKKYLKSGLKEKEAKLYLSNLKKIMHEEKPFLDNALGLQQLSELLKITTNQLSQLLNEQLNQNFYDFINSYRIEEFKSIVKNPKNKGFTLLAMAYECGFNSKTTFNTFFKKSTGKTPSQYYKETVS